MFTVVYLDQSMGWMFAGRAQTREAAMVIVQRLRSHGLQAKIVDRNHY